MKLVTVDGIKDAISKIQKPSIKESSIKAIRQLFNFAFNRHFISFNPSVAALDILNDIPRKEKRVVVPYTVNEIQKLLLTCRQNFSDMYLPLLLSITLGTRIAETIALKFSDIDFSSQTIYVSSQLGQDFDENGNLKKGNVATKTVNGMRSIPAPKWVIDEIIIKSAWFEHQKLFVPDLQDMGYICCHCNGNPFHRNSFTEDFHILTNMCGLRDIHWHDLRHMYAGVLKHNEVNMKAVSEFLGHHSPDFTEDIYVYQEETVFDCSILSEVWDDIRPENGPELGTEELFVPLTDADCMLYLS